ncbi:MAG: hypothetical protein NZ519_12835 [Bacteroidia bacterium]|nr:hypothetical protein [Bacteroidia bacterium]MDW8302665.1 hypothetical protein [Bacteroidia bacterium]
MKYFLILLGLLPLTYFITYAQQLDTGEIECKKIKPIYDTTMHNYLRIKVGENTDAVVKLVEKTKDKTIRMAYIRAGQQFDMINIPTGRYYVKIAYGKDWIFTSKNNCEGEFKTNAMYKQSKQVFDFKKIKTREGYQIANFELSLDMKIEEGAGEAMKNLPITKEQFNK